MGNHSGSNNIAIGFESGFNGNYENSISIGNSARAKGDNRIQLGNDQIRRIDSRVDISTYSDLRLKTNIMDLELGLDFVLGLRPVSYEFKGDDIRSLQCGFIAQEVEKVLHTLGDQFDGLCSPENDNDFYALRYAQFTIPLVRAVQEQQDIIKSQDSRIDMLEEHLINSIMQIEELSTLLNKLSEAVKDSNLKTTN